MKRIKSFLKNTLIYNFYFKLFHHEQYLVKKKEFLFYKALGIKDLVFDIGANIGDKTKLFFSLDTSVISVEPDLFNFQLLIKRFKNEKRITILNFAISEIEGEANFFVNEPGSPFNTLSTIWKNNLENEQLNRWKSITKFDTNYIVKTTTLDNLIYKYGTPDYIKIDVEGYELQCLKGLNKKIRIISFEANLPDFISETLQILIKLNSLDEHVKFNFVTDKSLFQFELNQEFDVFFDFIKNTDKKWMDIYSFME